MPFDYLSDDDIFGSYEPYEPPQPEVQYESDDIFNQPTYNEEAGGYTDALYSEGPEWIDDKEIFETYDLGERVDEVRAEEQRLVEETAKNPVQIVADSVADTFFQTVEASQQAVALLDRFGTNFAKKIFRSSDDYEETVQKLLEKYPDYSEEEVRQIVDESFNEAFNRNAQEALGPAHGIITENPEMQQRLEGPAAGRELVEMGQPLGMSEYAKQNPETLQYYMEGSGAAIAQVGKMIALNYAMPGLGYGEIALTAGTQQQKEAEARLRARGIDPNDAYFTSTAEGMISAGVESVLSHLPGERMMKVPAVRSKIMGGVLELIKTGGLEAVEEGAATLAQRAMREWIEQDPDAWEEWDKEFKDSMIFGAVGGMAGGAPVAAMGAARAGDLQRSDANQRADEVIGLMQTGEGRKALEELAAKEKPSRKDFEKAGITARTSARDRRGLARALPGILEDFDNDMKVAGERVAGEEYQRAEDAKAIESMELEQEKRGLTESIKGAFRTDNDLGKAVTEVTTSLLTAEEVKQLQIEKGDKGEQEPGALYQIPEAVRAAVEEEGHKSTTDEDKFFGQIWPKAIAKARSLKGAFKGALTLNKESRQAWKDAVEGHAAAVTQWEANGKKGPKPQLKDPFKSGEKFEKTINMAGIRAGVKEAVKDLIPFVRGKTEFQEYYRTEVEKERQAIAQKHPELAKDDSAFQFYRLLNGVASAQTELFKNTQETERAYAGYKTSGRLPVVMEQDSKGKDRPAYALPKGSEFGATLPGEIDGIAKALAEMDSRIPPEIREKLVSKERLTNDDRKKLKKYADEAKKSMNTTSSDLAANLWLEYARDGDDAFKGRVRTAFEIAGGSSAYNKARNYNVVNYLLDKFDGDLDQLMPWLNERISIDELKKLNAEVGFSETIGGLSDIKDTVWVAEGQETKIPRTFIFGPKVGAYILNRIADAHPQNANYNTMDVWESRVWRSYAKDLVDSDKGIAGGVPRRVYMRMAREFPKEFKKQTGMDVSVSAGQAARWYFGMEMMRQAGYAKVGDKQTIAGYTMKLMEEYMAQELGGGNPDMAMLEKALQEIREAPTKADKEAIAEKAPIFEGSKKTLGKDITLPKKLSKKAQKEADQEAKNKEFEAEAERQAVAKQAIEEGPTTTQEVVTPQQPEITSVTTLFQKSAGKIIGLMRQDPNGKIIIKGFEGANAETALHEVSHGARRLIWEAHKRGGEKASGLTNREINLIENWAGKKKKGEEDWSERMEERFAAGMSHFIATEQAPNKHLKKSFQKLRAFIKRLFTRAKHPAADIKMRPEVRAAFAKLLTRRQRLAKQQKVKKLLTAPKSWPAPYDRAWQAKKAYLKKMGMPERRQATVVKVDQEFKQRLADAFERMEHNPNDPEVKAAYDQLAKEVLEQWKAVEQTGLHVEFKEDDYDTPAEVHADLRDNNHIYVYPTSAGYGAGPIDVRAEYEKTGNPLLQIVPDVEIDGREVTYNDLFRIVHDYFGHGLEGTSFGERGEENAWQAHVRMFSPLAARAMTTETRGQNSWVNVQPENKVKPGSVYAPQKTGLLPEWASTERVAPDARPTRQKADDAAEGAAAAEARSLKAAKDEAAKGDPRQQQEQAEQPRGAAVAEVAADSEAIATKGSETVPKEFINEEGKVTLYRYSKADRGESYTIDPAKTVPSGYSRNEYQRAQTPRTFFYLNTSEKEGIVGNELYTAEVDANDIYNLITDTEGLKDQFRDGGTYDFDGIFAELIRRGKKGVYYNPGFHVVNMFEAVEGTKTPDVGRNVNKQKTQEIWSTVQKQIRDNVPAGFTFDPRTGNFPTDGFAVAPAKSSEYVIDLDQVKSWEIPAIIEEFAGMHAAKLAENDMHLGGWVSDGKLYLDLSYVVPGKNVAVKIAKDNDQLAIFDLGSGKEIKTSDADSNSSIYPNQRELAWKRDKGELQGKPISKTEVVDRILAFVGLKAGDNMAGKPRTVQGFYRRAMAEIDGSPAPGVEINIRRKELANIGVAIHEVAHYLDDKLGLTDLGRYRDLADSFANNLSDTEKMALADESYEDPGNRTLKEGFAEALRLYIMNENGPSGDGFRSQLAVTAFERFLHDPRNAELREFVKEARGLVEQYMRQPLADKVQRALANARGKIISPSDSYFARFSRNKLVRPALRYLNIKFANSMANLEAAEKEVERRYKEWWGTLPDSERQGVSAEQAWDRLLRETGGLPSQMRWNHANLTSHQLDKAIFEVLEDQDGKKYADSASSIFQDFDQDELTAFGQYMYAKVALQRHDASEVDPITGQPTYVPGEVDIADLREFVRKNKNDKFDTAAKQTTDYFNGLLRMMRDKGLILGHEYDAMVASHQLYMPFYRQFADENHGLGGRFLGVQAPIKKLKGGSVMPVLDVYDAMIDRTHEVLGAVNRRMVEQTFVDVFEKSGTSGIFMSRVTGPKSEQGPNVVTIMRNGQEVRYKVDPDIYQAMVMSGNPQLAKPVAKLLDILGLGTGIARKLLVNYNPLFPVRNYPRDFKTAMIKGLMDTTGIDDSGLAQSGTLFVQALRQVGSRTLTGESDVDKLYVDMGGDHNTRVRTSESVTGFARGVQRRRAFGKKTVRGKAEAFLAGVGKKAEMLNEHLELAPRKAAFLATLQALSKTTNEFDVTSDGKITGKVPQWAKTRAMSNAMEITVNFNRRGEWAPVLGKMFLFYNAAMQGSFTSRAQVWEKKKTAAIANIAIGMIAKLGGLMAMAAMASPEDEEKTMLDHYWEVADYYKETQDVFLLNFGGKPYGIALPKEREMAPVSRLYEKLFEYVLDSPTRSDDPAIVQAGEELKEAIFESLPITGGAVPTLLQAFFGYDLFRDQPIEGKWDDTKLDKNRYDKRTTTAAKFLSQDVGLHNLGLSPKEIDFLMRSAGYGSFASNYDVWFGGKFFDKGPLQVNEAPRQSMSDLYVKSKENAQHISAWSDGEKYGEKEEKKLLEDEAAFGMAESIAKAIRNSSMSDSDKSKYTTGIARWALGRNEVADFPNPLVQYESLPKEVVLEVQKAIKGLARKPRLTEKTPEGVRKFKAKATANKTVMKRVKGLK